MDLSSKLAPCGWTSPAVHGSENHWRHLVVMVKLILERGLAPHNGSKHAQNFRSDFSFKKMLKQLASKGVWPCSGIAK